MLLEAPPSRYRVVERGGRLTVIDTQGVGTPRTAREIAGARTPQVGLAAYPRARSAPEPSRRAPTPATAAAPGQPPSLLRAVAANLSGDVRDGSGRLMLSTAAWIDARGPRDIALSPAGERALGALCLATIAGFALILGLLIALPELILPALLIGFVLLSQARPFVTRAIDALARR